MIVGGFHRKGRDEVSPGSLEPVTGSEQEDTEREEASQGLWYGCTVLGTGSRPRDVGTGERTEVRGL